MKTHMIIGLKFLSRAFFALSLIGLLTTHGNSQTTTSLTLRLSVVDTQGTVVPGATVVLIREGTEITGVTTADGTVTFVNLQPGTNKVTVKATGFPTLEQSVTVSGNQSNDFTLSVGPASIGSRTIGAEERTAMARDDAPKDGAQDITEKVKSLRLGIPGRFARGLQYEYKLIEQPGTVLVNQGSGAGEIRAFLRNPQDNLQQHAITFKFAELFPDRLSLFKRGSDYLNKYPNDYHQAADAELSGFLCGDKHLITCLTKGGSWWQRFLMGTSINISFSERALVQQQVIAMPTQFGKKYQVNGGFTFDPAKLFPNATNWRGTFEDVQKIDKALALLGASDAIRGTPWKPSWVAALIPKVEFKILSQFDFVKSEGALIEAPFPERALNTWTFTWDLTRVIPDTKNRIDADAITETLGSLGKEQPPQLKKCTLRLPDGDRVFEVKPAFNAESCRKLAKLLQATSYEFTDIK